MEAFLNSLLTGLKILLTSLTTAAVVGNPIVTSFPALTNQAVAVDTSRNWSGYVAQGGHFTKITGSWIVPTVEGGNNFSADATWVGIGGVVSRDLIQSGTQATLGRGGDVEYQAWIEMLPSGQRLVPINVRAGDAMSVTIASQGNNNWQIWLIDNSTGQSYQTNVTYASSFSSADWIEEAPSTGKRFLPLDNFGTVQFTHGITIKDGENLTIAQAEGKPIDMGQAGNIIAQASNLGADDQSFSVSRADSTNVAASQTQPVVQIVIPGRVLRHRFFPRANFY